MNWELLLKQDEELRWEAKPAPRCYTFRHWRFSSAGALIFLLTLLLPVLFVPAELAHNTGALRALLYLPSFLAFWLFAGPLLVARLEWDRVFYAVTDRRLLVRRGVLRERIIALPLQDVAALQLEPLGEHLAHVRIKSALLSRPLRLCCIEYPQNLLRMIEGEEIAVRTIE